MLGLRRSTILKKLKEEDFDYIESQGKEVSEEYFGESIAKTYYFEDANTYITLEGEVDSSSFNDSFLWGTGYESLPMEVKKTVYRRV
jgi:hypothetical protein